MTIQAFNVGIRVEVDKIGSHSDMLVHSIEHNLTEIDI